MRPIWIVLIYVSSVFVLGALLAPWLYWSAQAAAPLGPLFRYFADSPFHRYVLRSILGVALLGIWIVSRYAGIRSWRDLGFATHRRSGREFGTGLLLGFVSLAVVAILAVLFGARHWNTAVTASRIQESMARALVAAVVVSLIEETLFRGVLHGTLRRGHHWATALFCSSGIYAIVHFFKLVEWTEPLTWYSGLQLLGRMMQGFLDLEMLIPPFLVLLLVGMILALGFERTGSLWFSIGAHAGWIFWLKIYGVVTAPNGSRLVSFWGTSKLTDGWFAAIVLMVPLFVLWDSKRLRTANIPID